MNVEYVNQPNEPSDARMSFLGWAVAIYAALCLSSMAVMNIAAALVIVALIHRIISGKSSVQGAWARFRKEAVPDLFAKRIFLLSVLLAAACAVSLLAGKFAPVTFNGRSAEIRFFSDFAKVWYLFWPFVLLAAFRLLTNFERLRALKTWLIAFTVLSLIGLLQFLVGWPRPQPIPGHAPFFHVTLFLGHHLSVASILIFPFFAVLDLMATRTPSARFGWGRGAFVFAALVGTLALSGTFSRMLWLALPAGILLWMVLTLKGKARWILVAASLGLGLAISQWAPVKARMGAGMGIQERVALWQANFEFFKVRPLTGIGWRNTEELSYHYFSERNPGVTDFFIGHAHNNLLEMLGGTGAFGTLAWIAWSFAVLWAAWSASRQDRLLNISRGLFCAWIVFHLNGLTQVNFWEGKVMHQMAWVLAWTLFMVASTAFKREHGSK